MEEFHFWKKSSCCRFTCTTYFGSSFLIGGTLSDIDLYCRDISRLPFAGDLCYAAMRKSQHFSISFDFPLRYKCDIDLPPAGTSADANADDLRAAASAGRSALGRFLHLWDFCATSTCHLQGHQPTPICRRPLAWCSSVRGGQHLFFCFTRVTSFSDFI